MSVDDSHLGKLFGSKLMEQPILSFCMSLELWFMFWEITGLNVDQFIDLNYISVYDDSREIVHEYVIVSEELTCKIEE